MKVQTAVLLLCFLSGVLLSVVQAKPCPALMRELAALEKYIEKKEDSEGTDGENENQGKEQTDDSFIALPELPTTESTVYGQEQKIQDKNNNEETNTAEGSVLEASENYLKGQEVDVLPTNPEDAPPKNREEPPYEERESSASGVKGEGNLPLEGNKSNPSEGQVENGMDQIYEILDEVTRTNNDALDKLSTLGEALRAQIQNDDRKFTELENKSKKAKEKTNEKIGQLENVLEEIKRSKVGLDETPSVGKESVRENVPARRSHMSDTEFLNMLHSLLTYS